MIFKKRMTFSNILILFGLTPQLLFAAPAITVSNNTLNFPTTCITLPNRLDLTIGNTGPDPLVYTSITVVDPSGDYRLLEAPDLSNQPQGQNRVLTVEFSPTSSSAIAASLVIITNDPTNPTTTIPLNGNGIGSKLSISATAVDFGALVSGSGSTPNQPITLFNSGSTVLTFSTQGTAGVELVGANSNQFTIISDTGETTLNPGQSRLIVLSFVPTLVGVQAAQLRVTTDPTTDCDRDEEIALTGTGITGPFVRQFLLATTSPFASASSVEWYTVFNRKVVGVDPNDFTLSGAGTTGASITSVTRVTFSADDQEEWYIIRANRGTLSSDPATLGLNLVDDNTIRDVQYNLTLVADDGTPNGSVTGPQFTLDETPPTLTLSKLDSSPTDLDSVRFLATASEAVGPLPLNQILRTSGSLAPLATLSTTGPDFVFPQVEYTVTATLSDPSTDGLLQLNAGLQTRSTRGLVTRYNFSERAGFIVGDSSGFGAPQNLTIPTDRRYFAEWIPGNGFWFSQQILVTNPTPPAKAYAAISDPTTGSQEFSVEALFSADHANENDAARIITLSEDTGSRNLTLGIDDNDLFLRIRTTLNPGNAQTPELRVEDVVTGELQHVLCTRSAAGVTRIYLDGQLVLESTEPGGDLTNWDTSYPLALGDEQTEDRSFIGDLYYAALHSVALTPEEAAQNAAVLPLADFAGNPLQVADQESYIIDQQAPTFSEFEREFSEITNRADVSWLLTFSEPVLGLDVTGPTFDQFTLVATGVTGAQITSIQLVPGETTQYRITAARGTGDGTIGLNLSLPTGVTDLAGRPLVDSIIGPLYTIDTTPPTLVSITRLDSTPSRALDVHFRVEFSEPVTGLEAEDFLINFTDSLANVQVDSLNIYNGEPNVYEIHVGTGTGDGQLSLSLIPTPTFTDQTDPTPNAFGTPTNNTPVSYTIDKNDEPADIQITGTTITNGDPAGTLVGTLSVIDFDPADTHTFALANPFFGENGLFTIVNGNEVRTTRVVDLTTITLPALITVRATDNGPDTEPASGLANLSLRESMTITINPATTGVSDWQFHHN